MELDEKENPNSNMFLDLKDSDVASNNVLKDNVSLRKETSLSNMQLPKLPTNDNNKTEPTYNSHQQSTKDPLITGVNPPSITNNNNISCMEEDGAPQHLSHKNLLVA